MVSYAPVRSTLPVAPDPFTKITDTMHIVVTIDVEEDGWGNYHESAGTTENIRKIPLLQKCFENAGIMPTYLIDYLVATDPYATGLFREIFEDGKCEIGTHIHPWNTPPFDEERNSRNSMLCNLPEELQYRKLKFVHETIKSNLLLEPVSFRAGRWAFSDTVARNIHRLGYKVDTSVTPYVNWSDIHGPDYSDIAPDPYRQDVFDGNGGPEGVLIEIPASIGYLQGRHPLWNKLYKTFKRKHFDKIRMLGILGKLNILNKVWLSPEICNLEAMVRLVERFRKDGIPVINLVFHSNSLKHGLNPFVQGEKDLDTFMGILQDFLGYVKGEGIRSIRLMDILSFPDEIV